MTTTLILTSTVCVNLKKGYLYQTNKNERLKTYLKSILKWLEKTNFNIVLVENSGYAYDELNDEKEKYKHRFEVISFLESDLENAKYLENDISKGSSELFSINYAYDNSRLVKQSNFIIKITARFFIPELEEYLSNYDLDVYDCLTQSNRLRCEMVGSHSKNFAYIFNLSMINKNGKFRDYVEGIWKERTSDFENILICKEFNIETTQRGGLNQTFDTI
jgi:hypothetical protein